MIVSDFFAKIYPGLMVKSHELVVDLGSGDKPFWRADVCVDKQAFAKEHRFTSTTTTRSVGMYIDSDVASTPFVEHAFDFSFCSHLLEHVEEPGTVIEEIMRISNRGYIAVPDGMFEMISPYPSHLWFVFYDKGVLVFVRKSKNMQAVLRANRKYCWYLKYIFQKPVIQFYWNNVIRYRVIDDIAPSERYNGSSKPDAEGILIVHYISRFIIFLVRKVFYRSKGSRLEGIYKHVNISHGDGKVLHSTD